MSQLPSSIPLVKNANPGFDIVDPPARISFNLDRSGRFRIAVAR